MTDIPNLTYLITGTQYGGATVGMVRLLSGLRADEFDVTVVAIAETEKGVTPRLPEHVSFRRLGISNKFSVHRLFPLVDILRNTDILVCSGFHASAVGAPLGRLVEVPQILVWQHNTSYQTLIRRAIFRISYQLADQVLADSEAVRKMIQEQFNISGEKVTVLPIAGVDTARFKPIDKSVRQDKNKVSVITIGRLVEQKGYFDLIECARRVGENFQFHVIGTGELRDELENKAPKNVTLLGRVDDAELLDVLASGDIYFQPSKHEGLCMTVIEAMSCELPVVASGVGGITESTVHGKTGYLCESGDIDCFCKRLRELGDSPSLRQKMGSAGRKRVKAEYSQSALAEEFRMSVQKAK